MFLIYVAKRILLTIFVTYTIVSCHSDINKNNYNYTTNKIFPKAKESGKKKRQNKCYNKENKYPKKKKINNKNSKIDKNSQPLEENKVKFYINKYKLKENQKKHIEFTKIVTSKLKLSKIYIMGAVASTDFQGQLKKNKNGLITYTYYLIGELHNRWEKSIENEEKLFIEYRVFYREKDKTEYVEYKKKHFSLKNLDDFENENEKIKMPILPGEIRRFKFKIEDIPETHYKIGLFVTLKKKVKGKEEIWSEQIIPLHKPPPPPIQEKFFDFLKQPSSTKWWYLTLFIGGVALLLAAIGFF